MVKSTTEKAKRPSLNQVVCIDVETNDLIYEIDEIMPYTIQFTAVHGVNEKFDRLVMSKDENFTIERDATRVNGWTKESLLKAITSPDQTFPKVWSEFLDWLVEIGLDLDQDIYLCAYNGFDFDFRVIINELRRFGIYEIHNFKLLDPWLDHLIFEKTSLSLDAAFKQIQKNSMKDYAHSG